MPQYENNYGRGLNQDKWDTSKLSKHCGPDCRVSLPVQQKPERMMSLWENKPQSCTVIPSWMDCDGQLYSRSTAEFDNGKKEWNSEYIKTFINIL